MKPLMYVLRGRLLSINKQQNAYHVLLKDAKGRITPCNIPVDVACPFGQKSVEVNEGLDVIVRGSRDFDIYGQEVFYVDNMSITKKNKNERA